MALMTLVDNTGYPTAWPCGPVPVTKRQAQKALDNANEFFTSVGLEPPYVKAVVPENVRSSGWSGIVHPMSPLAKLAYAAETEDYKLPIDITTNE